MSNYDPTRQELDDLLRQVDSLLEEEPLTEQWHDAPFSADSGDIDEYIPLEARQEDPQMFYQNAANGYGAQVRNFRNNYGNPQPEPVYQPEYEAEYEPEPQPPLHDYARAENEYIEQTYGQGSIPAYNADFRQSGRERSSRPQTSRKPRQTPARTPEPEYDDYTQYTPAPRAPVKKSRPKRGCLGCGCATVLLALALTIALVVGIGLWIFQAPQAEEAIGPRKKDTAAVLICGTDLDGTRTDTMMLLYLSGSEKQVGLLSLPRDTYTRTTAGNSAKLNTAYGRNNCGEEGMEALLDYVRDIIGYRPDGYVLVDMATVPRIVDLMGGVSVDVPQTVETEGVVVHKGTQLLSGQEALALLRHRQSYATADLGRIQVQRLVVQACMDQWVSLENLPRATDAIELLRESSLTNLDTRNFLWIGKTMLTSLSGGFSTETLPGYADYIGDASYYLLNRESVAELINSSFNPYDVTISPEELNIAS